MVHSLFLEPCVSMSLASHLLFVVLTVCVCREVLPNGKLFGGNCVPSQDCFSEGLLVINGKTHGERTRRKQGPVAAFDSYILAAVCALACELQLFPLAVKNGKYFNSEDLMLLSANLSESSNGFERGITSAIIHTRRFLGILESLFSLNPSSVGTSWSCSSNEMVAAAMVAAHVSELFGRSKACMSALSALMRCNWDSEICSRATSLYHLIDIHGKSVATILDKAGPLEAHLMHIPFREDNSGHQTSDRSHMRELKCHDLNKDHTSIMQLSSNDSMAIRNKRGTVLAPGQDIFEVPLGASDLANFLIKDNLGRFDYTGHNLLKAIIAKEQETCFSVVSLLWHKLLLTPENVDDGRESIQRDWMQIVDALCNVVSASPKKASAAIVLQAERDLQPWIARDGGHSQLMWRTNQRILKLISRLMNNPGHRETIIIVASASDLLLRATDGMLVDGEECTLLQLELLQASARAIQVVLDCGESGMLLADGLSNLLKCRLPTTTRCLSHSSVRVRALSTSVLQDIMCSVPMKSYNLCHETTKGTSDPLILHNISWPEEIEQCLKWEVQSRRASGMTTTFLETAARELSFENYFYYNQLRNH